MKISDMIHSLPPGKYRVYFNNTLIDEEMTVTGHWSDGSGMLRKLKAYLSEHKIELSHNDYLTYELIKETEADNS